MKHIPLRHDPRMKFGLWTDLFVVTHEDLTTSSNGTEQALVLDALAVGDLVFPDTVMQVKTNFAGVTVLTASVGVTGSLEAFCAAGDMLAAGGEHYAAGAGTSTYPAVAAINLVANFVPDAAENVAAATAGELLIWMRISRIGDRTGLQY